MKNGWTNWIHWIELWNSSYAPTRNIFVLNETLELEHLETGNIFELETNWNWMILWKDQILGTMALADGRLIPSTDNPQFITRRNVTLAIISIAGSIAVCSLPPTVFSNELLRKVTNRHQHYYYNVTTTRTITSSRAPCLIKDHKSQQTAYKSTYRLSSQHNAYLTTKQRRLKMMKLEKWLIQPNETSDPPLLYGTIWLFAKSLYRQSTNVYTQPSRELRNYESRW